MPSSERINHTFNSARHLIVTLAIYFIILHSKDTSGISFFQDTRRQWPPMKIYYYHLPELFSKHLLKETPQSRFNPDDGNYQFIIEALFAQFLEQVPILTDNIDEADVVYLDFFPTYLRFSHRNHDIRVNLSYSYFSYLKEHGLLEKELFLLSVHPKKDIENNFLVGIRGAFESLRKPHYFTIPYLTNFPHFPASEVNFSAPRKNFVFLSGSYRHQRKQIFDIMATMNNSVSVVMNRDNRKEIRRQVHNVPYIMSQTKYCLIPYGDSPTSKRFFDSVIYGCIPVIISDNYEIPFHKTQLNWDNCVIRIPEKKVKSFPSILNSITESEYNLMYQHLQKAREYIRFDNGALPTNGVGSILWELYYFRKNLGSKGPMLQRKEIKHVEKFMKKYLRNRKNK